ncbi:MAG: hypothetical protein ABIN05_07975 [candidate division WOR-3 bacterium]
MDSEEILNVFKENGGKIDYFKLNKFFSHDEMLLINDLINKEKLSVKTIDGITYVLMKEYEKEINQTEKILNVFKKNDGKIDYFKLYEFFNSNEISLIGKLLEEKKLEIEKIENGTYIVLKEEEKKDETIEEIDKKFRKDIILEKIKDKFKITEPMGLEEIFFHYISLNESIRRDERNSIITKLWFSLPIEDVMLKKVSDKNYIVFKIEGVELEFNENEILNQSNFIREFFSHFNIMLPTLPKHAWDLWITYYKNLAKEKPELKTLEKEDDLIADCVKNYIETSFVSEKLEDSLHFNKIFVKNGHIIIPNDRIKKIMEENGINKNYKKIALILSDRGYMIKSEPLKIAGETKRFWFFDKTKFNLKETVSEEDEEGQVKLGEEK